MVIYLLFEANNTKMTNKARLFACIEYRQFSNVVVEHIQRTLALHCAALIGMKCFGNEKCRQTFKLLMVTPMNVSNPGLLLMR